MSMFQQIRAAFMNQFVGVGMNFEISIFSLPQAGINQAKETQENKPNFISNHCLFRYFMF
ncbi:MAG: hypothetical protein NVSMB24_26850 [Mucilaginibacter sp.]